MIHFLFKYFGTDLDIYKNICDCANGTAMCTSTNMIKTF